jgi:DNA-binding NarL/FixJ family response regulator
MDLVMPNMDGVAATTRIKEQQPSTHVIVLTSFLDDDRVVPAIKAGATSYLLKDVAAADLARAIRAACLGQAQLHPEVARRLMQQVTSPRKPEAGADRPQAESTAWPKASNKEIAQPGSHERTVTRATSWANWASDHHRALYAVRHGLTEQ